jgi:hypothetical protein
MEMLILVLVAAAIAGYFLWGRRGSTTEPLTTAAAPTATAGAPLASIDAYRRSSPSNFYLGKPTCNRCGSTLVDTSGSVTSCRNCGTELYRN